MPPDPWVPADMLPALGGVRAASQGIADSITAYLAVPPDPYVPAAFISALTNVKIASQNIADDADYYIRVGGCPSGTQCGCIGTPILCINIIDPTSCGNQKGCYWSTEPGGGCLGASTVCSAFGSTDCVSQAGCHVGICIGGYCQ